MSLRFRQVKPAFWSDAKLLRLSPETRLFYIGTWCISDDAGWFTWEPEQVAIDLHMRPAAVVRAMRALTDSGRVVIHDCGHGQVLHLVDHQHLPGVTRRVETVYRRHLNACASTSPHIPAHPRTSPQDAASKGEGKGEGEGEGSPARLAGLHDVVKVDPETGGYVYVAPEAKA